MQQPTYCVADNLAALIAVVRSRADAEIFIGQHLNPVNGGLDVDLFSYEGFIVDVAHFRDLGVRRQEHSWSPVIAGDDGRFLDPIASLNKLFGPVCGVEAFDALFSPYGAGVWDPELIKNRVSPMTNRELVLERLHMALGALNGELQTGPAEEAQANWFYRENLDALEAGLEARDAAGICLDGFVSAPERAPVQHCLGGLVTVLPYFAQFAVVECEEDPGAPTIRGIEGTGWYPGHALNHLFGVFGDVVAFDVLFRAAGDGRWDHELRRCDPDMGHKELGLERIRAWRGWMLAHLGPGERLGAGVL